MTTTDDRVRRALRQIARDAAAQADPDKALAAVARRPRHLTTALWLGMAAAVAAGTVAYAVWPDDKDHVVAGGSSTTAANVPALTTASSVVSSTSVIPTTSVSPTTVAPPTTAVASTSGPTSIAGAADPLAPGVVEFTGIGQLRL